MSWFGRLEELRHPPIRKNYIDIRDEPTLEKIHNRIWKEIESLQEDGDCNKKKILHCENVFSIAGLGSMMMRYGVCLQVAFGLGRTFFIHQKEYAHFGGLTRFLRNESTKCGHLKYAYDPKGKDACNAHDQGCYLKNKYEFNNTHKVLVYNTMNRYPAPRRIPSTLPREIEEQLIKLKMPDPWLWFSSQFLGYLVMHVQPDFKAKMEKFSRDMNFQYPLASMHIRGGKDKTREAGPVAYDKYLSAVDKYFRDILPKMKYKYKTAYPLLIYKKRGFPKEVIESMLLDLHFLVRSNYTVCYTQSNVCRLLWSLKLATPPYRIDNRLVDVNGHKLDYYMWFGYSAPRGFSQSVALRESTLNLTLPDGTWIAPYTYGTMTLRQAVTKTYKGKTYKLRLAQLPGSIDTWKVKKIIWGHVFADDFVRWPGRPHYHFYDYDPKYNNK